MFYKDLKSYLVVLIIGRKKVESLTIAFKFCGKIGVKNHSNLYV